MHLHDLEHMEVEAPELKSYREQTREMPGQALQSSCQPTDPLVRNNAVKDCLGGYYELSNTTVQAFSILFHGFSFLDIQGASPIGLFFLVLSFFIFSVKIVDIFLSFF